MNLRDMRKPKLCHAEIGGLVQLLDDNFNPLPDMYLVCSCNGAVVHKKFEMYGLYSQKEPLFLVNIRTGEAQKMPHLSSRVVILSDAELHLVDKPKKTTMSADQFFQPFAKFLQPIVRAEEPVKVFSGLTPHEPPPSVKFIIGQRVLLDDVIVTIVRVSSDGRKLTIRQPDHNHDNEVMAYRVKTLPNNQL